MKSVHSSMVLLAALALVGGAQVARSAQAPPTPSPPATQPHAALPADSPAVAPAAGVEASALAELRNDLLASIREPGWAGARYGVMVVSLDHRDTLFALNPDLPLAPASNMKLYSTAAALYYLGPNFRFSTYLLADGEVRDSVLEGDLILFGTGDPAISGRVAAGSAAILRALADSLLARGVREVRGDLVGDGSYFDSEWLGRGWNPQNFLTWYSAPVGALSFAENVVSLEVRPGAAAGQPARITTAPQTLGLAVENRVRTVASGQTLVRFEHSPQGLVVSGQISRGHPGVARSASVVDPTNFAAAALRAMLDTRGIRVHGGVRTVSDPSQSRVALGATSASANGDRPHPRVLAVHLSPTLQEIASVTNQVSHNLYAEALLKTVGRVALGEGSFDAGARAVRYLLECEGVGVDSAAVEIVDGSGLSPLNRVTARNVIQLLDVMTRSEHWEAYHTSLPQAGARRPEGLPRMLGTPAEGNLRAKTGTIINVSSLSGYVRSADGERLAFSILANDVPSTWRAKRTEDAIGARLASFSRTAAPPPAPAARAEPERRQPSPPAARAPAARTYRVRQGDTLDGIARRHGVTLRELQQANPGVDPRRIRPGQTLRIPN